MPAAGKDKMHYVYIIGIARGEWVVGWRGVVFVAGQLADGDHDGVVRVVAMG